MGNAYLALKFFTEQDDNLQELCNQLISYNIERQERCEALYKEAKELIEKLVSLMGLAVDGQQHGHSMFSNSVGGVGGNAVYMDLAETGFGIDIVEAGTAQRDDLNAQLVKPVDDFFVDDVVDEYANAVKTCGKGNGIFVQVGFEIFDFKVSAFNISVESGHVIGFCVKKSNLHNVSSFCIR